MAEARQRKILSVRLGLLEEQRNRLSSVVSHRVNEIMQLGKSWIAGKKEDKQGKTLSYKDISDLIEDTDMLLAQELEQLCGEDQEAETPGDTSTSSHQDTATASQTADTEMLKSALARIQNLEESLSSLTTRRGEDVDKVRRFIIKVRDLEKDKNKAVKKVEKSELQEVTLKLHTVTQDVAILVSRVLYLENQILQSTTPTVAAHDKKLHTVTQDVADLVPRVLYLENQIQQSTSPPGGHDNTLRTVTQDVAYLVSRVLHLENQIQHSATPTGGHDEKLYKVLKAAADLAPKVVHLENQIQQTITPTLAVMVGVLDIITPKEYDIINEWTFLTASSGGHFDINTGIFTAPVAGTYAVALSIRQQNEGTMKLGIRKTPSGRNPNTDTVNLVAVTVSDRHDITSCDFSVVDMSVGDKLYVYVGIVKKGPSLAGCRFSIFLVK